jgi:hypothetical protein
VSLAPSLREGYDVPMQRLTILFSVLLLGAVVTVANMIPVLERFYTAEGTFFKIAHTAFPNPFLTPCLWGTSAFVLITIWVFFMFRLSGERRAKHLRLLAWVLAGCVVFAVSVFTKETYDFYHPKGLFPVGCSGDRVTNPFTTTCAFGALVYILGYLISRKMDGESGAK